MGRFSGKMAFGSPYGEVLPTRKQQSSLFFCVYALHFRIPVFCVILLCL